MRDGERAHCGRCHRCISIAWLIRVIDEQAEAIERAERKIERLYTRGVDTTSALRDCRHQYCYLAELSESVIRDVDNENDTLRGQLARLKEERQ
jgi:hypothetical protein